MIGSIEIVGTNQATKDLSGKIFNDVDVICDGTLHRLTLNDKKYLLDIKSTHIHCDHIAIFGMLSDDESYVGNIAFIFRPKINVDSEANVEDNT